MIVHWYCLDDFTADFLAVRDNFSREGLSLLFEYYDSIGEPVEFDPIAICCDWSEYSDPLEALMDYTTVDDAAHYLRFFEHEVDGGSSPAEALESILGVTVLSNGNGCFLVGV